MPEDPVSAPLSERSTLDQADASAAGSFGRYRLLQPLGEGGMGQVWLAEQMEPVRRQVALKVIKAGMDSAQVVARFEAERQALALMDHPAIATVLDGGTTPQGRPYLAMEYVKGEPITTYCDRHRLGTRQRLELFVQVCEGVQHAHQKGIIHRDLKPSNVLVSIQDDRPVPKIIDFGVAKATAQHLTERSLFTELGVLIGTPEYMSPEQAEMGGLDIDTRTDVYALGALLYELLTGSLPFDRRELRQAGLAEIQRIIREKEPPRPSRQITRASAEAAENRHTQPHRLAGELRGDLDWITMRALEKDRTRRYQTANALAADVGRHLNNEPVAAGPPSALYRARKFARRHRFGVAAAATVLLLLVAFAATMAVQTRRTARERDKAERLATFMVDLFKVSDPGQARGNTVTAREVLDRGAEKIARELADEPETRATMMTAMGNAYVSLGLYGPATPLLEEALRVRRQAPGVEPSLLARSVVDMAWLNLRKGDYAAAEPLAHEALALSRRRVGSSRAEVARALYLLGSFHFYRGDLAGAEPPWREYLAIQKDLLGPAHPDVARVLNSLAALLHVKGDYAGAATLYEESLRLKRKSFGSDHPQVATTLSNLAAVQHERGKFDAAGALYREVLGMERKLFGNESAEAAGDMGNLAELLSDKGDSAGAESLQREALRVGRKRVGSDHPTVAWGLTNLARILAREGRANEAAPLAREGLDTWPRIGVDPGDPNLAESAAVLGSCLVRLGRYQEAEPLLLRGYEILQAKSPHRRVTRQTLRDIVALYDAWGRPEEARQWRLKLEAGQSPVQPPAPGRGQR